MARYKHYDHNQTRLVGISYAKQILPGTFEFAVNRLIDEKIDLSVFAARYKNDKKGAPAYDPALLLKVILFAYSKGITSSRGIEELCRSNVICMALCADVVPHFTTLADFIATLNREIVALFRDVLLVCDEAGLIGREMFAVDGVKLPSNAAKEWSGTKEEFGKKVAKMQRAIEVLTSKHREADQAASERASSSTSFSGIPPSEEAAQAQAREKQIQTLTRASQKITSWLEKNEDKMGVSGKPKKSNITDNESAKMKTSKGVIQGYDGVAVVDEAHQIVVHAQAFGEAQEHHLLIPMLAGTREQFKALSGNDEAQDILKQVKLTADAGFHTEENMQYLFESGIEGYVADTLFRQRDPRFKDADRFKPDKPLSQEQEAKRAFKPEDFKVAEDLSHAICPAGKRLYRNGHHYNLGGYDAVKFTGTQRDCGNCPMRARCLRHPDRTPVRQYSYFTGRSSKKLETFTEKMKQRIDSEQGRYQYSKRLGTVEPVFAHICHTHGLKRFSHRGRTKVNTQWMLFCLVHNIGKIQKYGNLESITKH